VDHSPPDTTVISPAGHALLLLSVGIPLVVVALIVLALSLRIVKQYELGVLFRLGRVLGVREAGLTFIVPLVDVLHRVRLRIVTMPIQSQGIITRDNVSASSPRP
jgi:regulator of protease activity HflC (stomatin/prohibitin superfamily)